MNPFNYKMVNNCSINPKRGPNKLKVIIVRNSGSIGVMGLSLDFNIYSILVQNVQG